MQPNEATGRMLLPDNQCHPAKEHFGSGHMADGQGNDAGATLRDRSGCGVPLLGLANSGLGKRRADSEDDVGSDQRDRLPL